MGLYKTTSYINHSCNPNSLLSYYNNEVNVTCLENIKKDKEITISYGATYQNITNPVRRKAILLNEYNFECTCEECIKPCILKYNNR